MTYRYCHKAVINCRSNIKKLEKALSKKKNIFNHYCIHYSLNYKI